MEARVINYNILSQTSNATSYRSLRLDIGPLPERDVALEVWLSIVLLMQRMKQT